MYTENNNIGGGGGRERTTREKNKLMMLPSGLASLIDYTKIITIYYQLLDNLKPLHPNTSMQIFHTVHSVQILYSYGEEHLFDNQELLEWMIISCILITLMFDSIVIMCREIGCLGVNEFMNELSANHIIART